MISIIMYCYNADNTVTRTIQSVLNQTYQDFELIIVNDGSTDLYKEEQIELNEFYEKEKAAQLNC